MITLRHSTLDSDTLSLVIEAANYSKFSTAYLVVESKQDFFDRHKSIRNRIELLDISVEIVSLHSLTMISALLDSKLIFLRGFPSLLDYRFFNRCEQRNFINVFHGVITKASGNFRSDSIAKQREHSGVALQSQVPGKFLSRISNITDAISVGSDLEWFYRAAADGIKPGLFIKCGYPKYQRIEQLKSGEATSFVSEETLEYLSSDSVEHRILYAPTHKGINAETTLFPFEDFSVAKLREFLDSVNAEMYIRTHIREEEAGIYDAIVDGEFIKYAGHEFSPSATEILPYFDTLITDYSSIYTEFLPFDRPIIFIEDTENPYWRNKGLAFDYEKYFPGPKTNDFEKLLDELSKCLADDERYMRERRFVQSALIPDQNGEYLQCISQKILGE